jgi:hypothetical protein
MATFGVVFIRLQLEHKKPPGNYPIGSWIMGQSPILRRLALLPRLGYQVITGRSDLRVSEVVIWP